MKILLIRPPQISPNVGFPAGPRTGLPLGLLYIGGVLEKQGFEVEIFDALTDFDFNSLDLSGGLIHFGASFEEVEERIKKAKPKIIGINNPFSTQVEMALKVAKIAKKLEPRSLVVVGGPHASAAPETFLEETKDIDIVVRGEGEYVMLKICNQFKKGRDFAKVSGISYRQNGKVLTNPLREHIQNLDELPLPAYHLINMEKYFKAVSFGYSPRLTFSYPGSERTASVITSRGCPFNCIFCSIHSHMGKRWRFHSPEYVIGHLKHLILTYGIRHIHFEDDNLTLNQRRFETILDGLLKLDPKITWDTPNGVRADSLNEKLLRKSKLSGCTYLVAGIESGDKSTLDNIIGKKLNLEKVTKVAEESEKAGLDLHAFFIIGFPGEKIENMKKTLKFALMLKKRFNVFPRLNLAYPLLGTKLYEICKNKSYLTETLNPQTYSNLRGDKLERPMIETEDFEIKDLSHLSRRFHQKLIMASLTHSFSFLLKNPRVLIFVLRVFLKNFLKNPLKMREIFKDIYARYLLFENHLKRRVYGSSFQNHRA